MKKFKFTLQPVFNYKQTIEKLQKAELQKAQQALQALYEQERRLLDAYENAQRTLSEALERNINVVEALQEHDTFFQYIREKLEELRGKIIKAEEYKQKCQSQLIRTMKEIKTYTKLREEQYQEYQKEARIEEDKNMGDLVSFNVVSE